MYIKYELEKVELDGEIVAVPVGSNASELSAVIKCNATASDILEIMKNDVTEQDIVDGLKKIYNADKQTLKISVHNFVELLRKENLLAE